MKIWFDTIWDPTSNHYAKTYCLLPVTNLLDRRNYSWDPIHIRRSVCSSGQPDSMQHLSALLDTPNKPDSFSCMCAMTETRQYTSLKWNNSQMRMDTLKLLVVQKRRELGSRYSHIGLMIYCLLDIYQIRGRYIRFESRSVIFRLEYKVVVDRVRRLVLVSFIVWVLTGHPAYL